MPLTAVQIALVPTDTAHPEDYIVAERPFLDTIESLLSPPPQREYDNPFALPMHGLSSSYGIPFEKIDQTPGYFATEQDLDQLARKHATDKSSAFHDYANKYEFFLKKFRGQRFTLLELGVYHGASLKMWGEYFPEARIVGVDITPECTQYAGDNREVVIADVSDLRNLRNLAALQPTIVVDDAAHIWSHQIKALFTLFPALPRGGLYILEDLETNFVSYQAIVVGGKPYRDVRVSAYEILRAIAEVVTSHEHLMLEHKNPLLARFAPEIEKIAMSVELISFLHGSCILIKR